MKILIIGAGNVGLGIGSCILKAGQSIDFVAREDTSSMLKKKGLKRTGIFGEFLAPPHSFNIFSSMEELPTNSYDYILVCTKSFDSQKVAKDISDHPAIADADTIIVLFQNGWGNTETFANYFPKEQVFNARVITGFCRPEKNHVHITVHADSIHIGSLYDNNLKGITKLVQLIQAGGIPCKETNEIEKDLWAKMLYNCALNPLGAIFQVSYGALGESKESRNIMNCIVEEIFQIIEKAGHKTYWKTAEEYLKLFYGQLIPLTAGHESSMLQDIKAGKKTEIDAMNGAVIQLAKRLNTETPYNTYTVNMVKFLETRKEFKK